jgi:hypothetical protein
MLALTLILGSRMESPRQPHKSLVTIRFNFGDKHLHDARFAKSKHKFLVREFSIIIQFYTAVNRFSGVALNLDNPARAGFNKRVTIWLAHDHDVGVIPPKPTQSHCLKVGLDKMPGRLETISCLDRSDKNLAARH